MSEVLKHALISTPVPIDWDEAAEEAAAAALAAEQRGMSNVTAH